MKTNRLSVIGLMLFVSLVAIALVACGGDDPKTPDTQAPAAVSNLEVDTVIGTTAHLTWTATGDDGLTGRASSYELRYATDSTTLKSNWGTASQGIGVTNPKAPGESEEYALTDLTENQRYFVAIKIADEANNWSPISNIAAINVPDITPPAAVADLATDTVIAGTAHLVWTATGDDGAVGTAASYEIRYSTDSMILKTTWDLADEAISPPVPKASGLAETYQLAGLAANQTYYAAIKVADDAGNLSGMSNITSMYWTDSLTLILPNIEPVSCGAVAVPLTVANFGSVSGVQVYVTYSTANVTFDSAASSVLSDAIVNANAGTISIIWADMSQVSPLTLADGSTLVTLYFSNLSGLTALTFQPQTRVVNTSAGYFPLNKTNGAMTCGE